MQTHRTQNIPLPLELRSVAGTKPVRSSSRLYCRKVYTAEYGYEFESLHDRWIETEPKTVLL